jgi:hypothetical protein
MLVNRFLIVALIAFSIVGTFTVSLSQPNISQQEQYQIKPYDNDSSAEAKVNKNREQKANGGTDNQKCNNYWKTFLSWAASNDKAITAISTMCIASFTLTLFIATWLLWCSGERHAERQLRAYVNVDGAEVSFKPGETVALVSIKNSGQTPAYNVRHRTVIWVAECPLNSVLPAGPPSLLKSKSTISSQDILTMIGNHPISEQQKTAVAEGTMAIYVYGHVIYTDVFRKNRKTKFRLMYWAGSPQLPNKSFNVGACDEGNDAD